MYTVITEIAKLLPGSAYLAFPRRQMTLGALAAACRTSEAPLLYLADMVEGYREAKETGAAVVIADRGPVSTLVYQGARWGHDLIAMQVALGHHLGIPRESLLCFLHAPVEVCLARISARGQAEDYEREDALRATHARYVEIIDQMLAQGRPIQVYDSSRMSAAAIAARIAKTIRARPLVTP